MATLTHSYQEESDMAHKINKVLVVGAGPVGLLTALMLGTQGIPVEVFEANDRVDEQPRGLAYGPAAISVLRKAGVLDDVISRGFLCQEMAFRKLDGEYITGTRGFDPPDDPHVFLPVGSLSKLLLENVLQVACITVHWQHRAIGLGQDDKSAWIEVETDKQTRTFVGDFVVGCDGGNSNVRKALFGRRFPGYTWPIQLVSLNMYYPFEKYDWSDAQWTVHPDYWFLSARINTTGLWRVAFCEPPELTKDQVQARFAENLKIRLPGNPGPDQYRIDRMQPYRIHQRCAARMAVGRVLLAGDAAHLCNPMGGLGLTNGTADVGSLIDCLLGIDSGKASMDILNLYDKLRRRIFYDITHATSTANLARLVHLPEELIGKDEVFKMLERAQSDPKIARQIANHERLMGCDMTPFYDVKVPDDLLNAATPKVFEQMMEGES